MRRLATVLSLFALASAAHAATAGAAGLTWSAPQPIAVALTRLACPTPGFCAGVSTRGGLYVLRDVGSGISWRKVASAHGVRLVACPSEDLCVATTATTVLAARHPTRAHRFAQ